MPGTTGLVQVKLVFAVELVAVQLKGVLVQTAGGLTGLVICGFGLTVTTMINGKPIQLPPEAGVTV